MAYPASQAVVRNALDSITSIALRLKGQVQTLRTQSAAGSTPRRSYVGLQRQIQLGLDQWAASAAVPGLVQYAKDQYADQNLDIVAEYTAMRNAAIAVRDWIFGAIPTDAGSGAALLEIYDVGGNPTDIMVTVGQSNGFRTVADAFLATVG